MKFNTFSIALILFGLSLIACQQNSINNNSSKEIWAEGIQTISGKIIDVEAAKDGQIIKLKTSNNEIFTAIVSIPNLGDKANQYRTFKVGEPITFKGNRDEKFHFVVREILENY